MVPWLSKSKFEQLTFGQQVSLAGNGQCLPLMGSLAILALFGAHLTAERALAEADVMAEADVSLILGRGGRDCPRVMHRYVLLSCVIVSAV